MLVMPLAPHRKCVRFMLYDISLRWPSSSTWGQPKRSMPFVVQGQALAKLCDQ